MNTKHYSVLAIRALQGTVRPGSTKGLVMGLYISVLSFRNCLKTQFLKP